MAKQLSTNHRVGPPSSDKLQIDQTWLMGEEINYQKGYRQLLGVTKQMGKAAEDLLEHCGTMLELYDDPSKMAVKRLRVALDNFHKALRLWEGEKK